MQTFIPVKAGLGDNKDDADRQMRRGLPPGLMGALASLIGGGGRGPIIFQIGEDADSSMPNTGTNILEINPSAKAALEQKNVSIVFEKKDWESFLRAGKSIPSGVGVPSAQIPSDPPKYLDKTKEGIEVSPKVKFIASMSGHVVAEVAFPWLKIENDDAINQFTRESTNVAMTALKDACNSLLKDAPAGIQYTLDPISGSVDFNLTPSAIVSKNLGNTIESFFKIISAYLDYSRQLIGDAQHHDSLEVRVETPPSLEGMKRGLTQGGDFGMNVNSLLIKSKPSERLAHIGGNQELKDALLEIIEFHRNPEHFKKYGEALPTGMLFEGPPGTGKTLSGKVLAGELDMNFYYIGASDLLSPFFSQSEKNIAELFENVERPAILFFDEIDSVAKSRDGSDSVSGRVLNELLKQMDGLEKLEGIIVIGATNRKDVLDPAITRAGRLSHHVHVALPDKTGRLEILNIHYKIRIAKAEKDLVLFDKDFNLALIAEKTDKLSGADLEEILRRAVSKHARSQLRESTPDRGISTDDVLKIVESYYKEKKSKEEARVIKGFADFGS